jgi:hypothetical protein
MVHKCPGDGFNQFFHAGTSFRPFEDNVAAGLDAASCGAAIRCKTPLDIKGGWKDAKEQNKRNRDAAG